MLYAPLWMSLVKIHAHSRLSCCFPGTEKTKEKKFNG